MSNQRQIHMVTTSESTLNSNYQMVRFILVVGVDHRLMVLV